MACEMCGIPPAAGVATICKACAERPTDPDLLESLRRTAAEVDAWPAWKKAMADRVVAASDYFRKIRGE